MSACFTKDDGPRLALLWSMIGADELHQIGIADGAQRPHIVHHLMPLLLRQGYMRHICEAVLSTTVKSCKKRATYKVSIGSNACAALQCIQQEPMRA